MATGYTGGNDTLSDSSCDGALDDSCDGIHGTDNFGLELRGHMEFDLLEEILRCSKTTDNKNALRRKLVIGDHCNAEFNRGVPEAVYFELEWKLFGFEQALGFD